MRQRAGLALEVAACEIVEHEGTFLEVSGSEGFFDTRLTRQKPVHGGVEVIFVNVIGKGAFLSQGACEGLRPQAAGDGELGSRKKDACGDHGHAGVALRGRLGTQESGDAKLAHSGEDGLNVPVGPGAGFHFNEVGEEAKVVPAFA